MTLPFSIEQIETLIGQSGLFVAEAEGKIVGYLYAGN